VATFERPTAVCIAGDAPRQRLLVVDAKNSRVVCLGEARLLVKGGIVLCLLDAGDGEGGEGGGGEREGEGEGEEGAGGGDGERLTRDPKTPKI
jgi:hypothetical protein